MPEGRGGAEVDGGSGTVVAGTVLVGINTAVLTGAVDVAIWGEAGTSSADEEPHAVIAAAMMTVALHGTSRLIDLRHVCEVVMSLRLIGVTDGLLTVA